MKELEMQNMTVKRQPLNSGAHFDITKHRLIPPFQEKEVDKYFLHFEKVAENLKWPKEHWTLLLQSVIIAKHDGKTATFKLWGSFRYYQTHQISSSISGKRG